MAAAKLCCKARLRSESPDDMPPRPTRHIRSLANIKSHILNGKHVTATLDGHADENQPLYPSDDLELQRIFISASLPEDHPHASKMLGRKPEVDESIMRSPSFTNKLRKQLSRKSLTVGKSNVNLIKKPLMSPIGIQRKRKGSDFAIFPASGDFDVDAQPVDLTESRLASLRLEVGVAADERSGAHGIVPVSDDTRRSSFQHEGSRRSISVPVPTFQSDPLYQLRRSRSSSSLRQGLENMLTIKLPGPTFFDSNDSWPFSSAESASWTQRANQDATAQAPLTQPQQASSGGKSVGPPLFSLPALKRIRSGTSTGNTQNTDDPKNASQGSTYSLHLNHMQIPQHLRTQSQVSDISYSNTADRLWNSRITHASLNSVVLSSVDPNHRRNLSSSGFASSTVPSHWGRVVEDETSSIYSRRPSTTLEARRTPTFDRPYEIPYEPLHRGPETSADICAPDSCDESLTVETRKQNSTAAPSQDIGCHTHDAPVVDVLNHSQSNHKASSLPKSDSSGSLGKLSKFTEDFTEHAAKTTRKRRSVLQVLFPRLTRSKARSFSTPLLTEKSRVPVAMYDGSGDPSGLLPLPESTQYTGERSVSFNDLADADATTGEPRKLSKAHTSSRQSMVDYERNLSVVGDDRRRKSTVVEPALQQTTISDRRGSPEPVLRRASPLFKLGKREVENALMEKALQQHQLEKAALLRVNSKKPEAVAPSSHSPVFKSPFAGPPTSVSEGTPMDELDPLDSGGPFGVRKSQSMQELRPPQAFSDRFSHFGKKPSATWTASTMSTKDSRSKHRLTMPLNSWSQFPSHTRAERCATASQSDGITSRDFAYVSDSGQVQESASLNTVTPSSRKRRSRLSGVKKNLVVKSRSMTFGTVFRYYSSLFTSSAARNRRSSTATGGRLEHPELEVLPPIMPANSDVPHHMHVKDQVGRFVDHIKEESHHLKDESHDFVAHHAQHWPFPQTGISLGEAGMTDKEKDGISSLPNNDAGDDSGGPKDTCRSLAMDGVTENENVDPERAPNARRLSRMYQACVQLPTSLDVSKESQEDEETDNSGYLSNGPSLPTTLHDKLVKTPNGFLTIPSNKTRMSSGPIVRRFPSATIVDDRKGHWRSISLISTDSGKSIRKSTRDLLEFMKTAENEEREKLMKVTSQASADGAVSS